MNFWRQRVWVFVGVIVGVCAADGAWAQSNANPSIAERFDKHEVAIEMRDGVKLFTAIYTPRDKSRTYPIMMNRTCYSVRPYGEDNYSNRLGPSKFVVDEGYIFVHQDVRGRWMSEGTFDNMRPHVDGDLPADESSDTYDTIEWLLKNVEGHNGKVGMWGISYPGFYSAAALPDHHPALAAVSPQAPISDFFFDDFRHQGTFLLSYFVATATFGYQHSGPTKETWYPNPRPNSQDAWTFYTDLIPLSNADKYYGPDNFFWQQQIEHPNYDEFWQARSILPHLKNIRAAVLTVGGFFDAEDLYGPLNIYRKIEANSPQTQFNGLVMGPWGHGDWARGAPVTVTGNVPFGEGIAPFYQEHIEAPFFKFYLKGEGQAPKFEALMFDTGTRSWEIFDQWPPQHAPNKAVYLQPQRYDAKAANLSLKEPPLGPQPFVEYVSDPGNPVPYRKREDIQIMFTPRHYMTDDQRFAIEHPGVITFATDVLTEPLTMAGDLVAKLFVSTDQSDADWVVKLIDVYPEDHPQLPGTPEGIKLAGYQQMVRSEVMRARFRNGHVAPVPMTPNEVTAVDVPLQDVLHTFKPGHRVMVQIQSTWFPLIDVNPQKYVDNIFKAKKDDFVPAQHRVYASPEYPSRIEFKKLDRQ